MKALFWTLSLSVLAVVVALAARLNDGYVLLVMPTYRAEISLNLFLVIFLAVFALVYALTRMVAVSFDMPRRVKEFRARRQQDLAYGVFQDAVRLLFEGRFAQALKKAAEAHAAGTAPGLSALIAARAAQRLRTPAQLQDWLSHAKNDDPRTEAATLMLEAEMANEERRFDDALTALQGLGDKRHPSAMRLELRARQGVGDWDGVLRLARQLGKRDAMPAEVLREIRMQAHLAAIKKKAGDGASLTAYLKTIPEEERGKRVDLAAARALVALGGDAEAGILIETALAREDGWQSELAAIYGRLAHEGMLSRIAKAEGWLSAHPDDAVLLLALGRMCLSQRLWGKAQSYLEASLSVQPTHEAHLALAGLCEQLEKPDEASRHYRESARLHAA